MQLGNKEKRVLAFLSEVLSPSSVMVPEMPVGIS
jgi:hypothetical protein